MPQVVYPDTVKAQAAALFVTTGNLSEVSRQLDIPRTTLHDWQKDRVFQEVAETCRKEQGATIRAGLADIVENCLAGMRDRLTYGDEVYINGGKDVGMVLKRKKVDFKSLAIGAAIAIDKSIMIAKGDSGTEQVSKIDSLIARLDKMADHYLTVSSQLAQETTPAPAH
jgi:hypothetical protein